MIMTFINLIVINSNTLTVKPFTFKMQSLLWNDDVHFKRALKLQFCSEVNKINLQTSCLLYIKDCTVYQNSFNYIWNKHSSLLQIKRPAFILNIIIEIEEGLKYKLVCCNSIICKLWPNFLLYNQLPVIIRVRRRKKKQKMIVFNKTFQVIIFYRLLTSFIFVPFLS